MTAPSGARPGPTITSPANPHVKAAVRLRDRREREATGMTIVDGAREIVRALRAGIALEEAFVCEDLARTDEAREAIRGLEREAARGRAVWRVTEAVLERIAFGDRAEGAVAIVATPSSTLAELDLSGDPLIVILEGVEKPGNLGAVLRSADAAGADALVAADPRTDLYNPNAIRASLGTVFAMRVASATTEDVRAWLRAQAVRIVAARVDAPRLYTEADLTGSVALAFGSEAGGLSDAWDGADVLAVRLPMLGAADSLNVAATAAVMLYEARRQRGMPG